MKNFNNLNSTSQSVEDNPGIELFHNGVRHVFLNRSNFNPQVTPVERSDTAIIEAHKEAYKIHPQIQSYQGK